MEFLNPSTNYVGTVLFLSYIATALILSTRTTLHLHKRHRRLLRLDSSSSAPSSSLSRHHRRSRHRLTALTILAVASFASLSYHMLSFLHVSYTAFCASRRLNPFPIASPSTTAAQLWAWVLGSTLFADFARDVATATGASGAWVQTALLGSLGMGLLLGIEGRRRRSGWSGEEDEKMAGERGEEGDGGRRRLGELVVLAQVLPVGFAGTLFLIGTEIETEERRRLARSESKPSAEKDRVQASRRAKQGAGQLSDVRVSFAVPLAVTVYLALLLLLQRAAEASTSAPLVSVVLLLRVCLFVSFLATRPMFAGVAAGRGAASCLGSGSYRRLSHLIFFLGCVIDLVMAWMKALSGRSDLGEVMSGLWANPAVSALGIDSVICILIIYAIWVGTRSD